MSGCNCNLTSVSLREDGSHTSSLFSMAQLLFKIEKKVRWVTSENWAS